MVEIKDIVDRESLEAWLEGQPRKTSVAIAYRLAMRALPISLNWQMKNEAGNSEGKISLKVLRRLLVAGVAASGFTTGISNEIKLAAVAAGPDPSLAHPASNDPNAVNTIATVHYSGAAEKAAYISEVPAFSERDRKGGHTDWGLVQTDCLELAKKGSLESKKLWGARENPLLADWKHIKSKLQNDAVNWSFWIKWYEAALDGEQLSHEVLEKIALFPSSDWEKGPAHVNGLIAKIEAELEAPQISTNYTKSIQQAVAQNKAGIAPQIEALTEILSAEIERLRGKNPADEIEQEENKRLRVIFEGLQVSIVQLGALVPKNGEPSQYVAEEMDGLLKVYVGEFKKWPRENAADMVDSTVRVALVGMTAGVVTLFGASALVGVAIGGIAFGGKKLAGAAKALKDSSSGGS